MSDCYHMEVEVEGLPEDRRGAVTEAIATELELDSDDPGPDGGTLRVTGYQVLDSDTPPDAFAYHLVGEIWAAAGGYHPVRFRATLEPVKSDAEIEYTHQEHAE